MYIYILVSLLLYYATTGSLSQMCDEDCSRNDKLREMCSNEKSLVERALENVLEWFCHMERLIKRRGIPDWKGLENVLSVGAGGCKECVESNELE